jgi:hypothetical protein
MKTQYNILKYEDVMNSWLIENMLDFKVESGEVFTASCKTSNGKSLSAKSPRRILAVYDLFQIAKKI